MVRVILRVAVYKPHPDGEAHHAGKGGHQRALQLIGKLIAQIIEQEKDHKRNGRNNKVSGAFNIHSYRVYPIIMPPRYGSHSPLRFQVRPGSSS